MSATAIAPATPARAAEVAPPADRGAATDRGLPFALFAIIFGLGTAHHELQWILEQQLTGPLASYLERHAQVRPTIGWPSEVGLAIHLAVLLLAVPVIVLPWRRTVLAGLAVPFLLSQLASPERIASHNSMMAAALGLILILRLAEGVEALLVRRRAPAGTGTDWHGWTVTGLLWVVGLTYFFAGFTKLNETYFWPRTSPAADFILPYTALLGIPRGVVMSLLAYPLIYGSVLTELLLPLLLWLPRTRLFACILGLVFHLPMLAQGVMDFPSLILAFYPLFLTPEQARVLLDRFLSRPSIPRLVTTLLGGSLGVLTIRQAEHVVGLYAGSPGLDPLLAALHSALLYATFVFWIYVLATLVGQVMARGAPGAKELPAHT